MRHAERPDGPVAASRVCGTHGPLSVATRTGDVRCEFYSAVRLAVVDEG